MRVAVIGAGAVGSYIAGLLTRHGVDVRLFTWARLDRRFVCWRNSWVSQRSRPGIILPGRLASACHSMICLVGTAGFEPATP